MCYFFLKFFFVLFFIFLVKNKAYEIRTLLTDGYTIFQSYCDSVF